MAATVSQANSERVVYVSDLQGKRPGFFTKWERLRHSRLHWLSECFAEAMGVFLYTYPGVGSTAIYVIGNLMKESGLSSLFQIGLAYGGGIFFAVGLCASTSGGHLNPCITIVHVLFKGFPPLKALRYIIAQILGGYIACLLIYAQYHHVLKTAEATVIASVGEEGLAAINFTPNGPAGIFAIYAQTGSNLGQVFMNEFVTDFFLALVIFGCLDPSNVLIPPPMALVTIALAYASAVWGFAPVGLAANSARDIAGRLAAMTIWGREAAGNPHYAAIAALTNIPATILACIVHELMFVDSDRVVPQAQREFYNVHALHRRRGPAAANGESSTGDSDEKEYVDTIERV
ncbi:Aquaporin-like protein [Mycena venus]|uniref:Aquaporin-like protein n=1 Tax=Mycena venus TaxID=2733690 RepID=A0A8H7DEU4_9AGAR|nr:Aquaporin-like protein [Mycena venus]